MSTLFGRTPKTSYPELLKISTTTLGPTLTAVSTGDGTSIPLRVSSTSLELGGVIWPSEGYGPGKILTLDSDGVTAMWATNTGSGEAASWNDIVDKPAFIAYGSTAALARDAIGAASQSDISEKQPLLVSGTNIKTVNGQTILGSGDVVILGQPGPKGDDGDKGDPGEIGPPGATTWAGITDKPVVIAAGSTATAAKQVIGLENVENTSDANKPVSTATQTALSGKADVSHVHTIANVTNLQSTLDLKAPLASPTFTGTVSGITKSMVGLSNVDNTSDSSKPISTATQTALDLKQNVLVSGTSIKTINGISLLGSGDLTISAGGGGSVVSVGLSAPSTIFDVTNSPITNSGNLTLALKSQNQALVLASPASSSGAPVFRSLVASDIPTLNQDTTGNAATVTNGVYTTGIQTITGAKTFSGNQTLFAKQRADLNASSSQIQLQSLSGGAQDFASLSFQTVGGTQNSQFGRLRQSSQTYLGWFQADGTKLFTIGETALGNGLLYVSGGIVTATSATYVTTNSNNTIYGENTFSAKTKIETQRTQDTYTDAQLTITATSTSSSAFSSIAHTLPGSDYYMQHGIKFGSQIESGWFDEAGSSLLTIPQYRLTNGTLYIQDGMLYSIEGDPVTTGTAVQSLTNKSLNNTTVANYVKFNSQYSGGTASGNIVVNFNVAQKQIYTLAANLTIGFSFPGVGNYQLILLQDATGGRTVTWSGLVRFVGSATAPAINTAASGYTVVSLFYDGTRIFLGASKVDAA